MGYAYAMGVRYGLGFRLALDSEFRESDHPRDKDGKFAKNSESGVTKNVVRYPGNQIDSSRIRGLYSRHVNRLNGHESIFKVLREAARETTGYVMRSFGKDGESPVYVGRAFVREIGRNISKAKGTGSSDKEIAKNLLFAMSHIDEIIRKGTPIGKQWENNKRHHGDLDFLHLLHLIRTGDRTLFVILDIQKQSGSPVTSPKEAYNINPQGSATYADKFKSLTGRAAKDSAPDESFVVTGLYSVDMNRALR